MSNFKKLCSCIASASGISLFILCLAEIWTEISFHGIMRFYDYAFTKAVIGSIAIGLGFALPAIICANKNISLFGKTLIYTSVGCIIMTMISFIAGWIPLEDGIFPAIVTVIVQIIIAILICAFAYQTNKKKAIRNSI